MSILDLKPFRSMKGQTKAFSKWRIPGSNCKKKKINDIDILAFVPLVTLDCWTKKVWTKIYRVLKE